MFGAEAAGGREIPDGAQPELRVSHAVEVRARGPQILENSRVQHATGEFVQAQVGVVRRVACREGGPGKGAWVIAGVLGPGGLEDDDN